MPGTHQEYTIGPDQPNLQSYFSARAPTPRRRRVGPIGGYVSSHCRMDGLNPVGWRQHHDPGAHVGFDCLVFVNPSGARLQRFNRCAHEASRCRLWAARVVAELGGIGGDGPAGLALPEIAQL